MRAVPSEGMRRTTCPSNSNSTFVLGINPAFSRMSIGIVTCPFDVIRMYFSSCLPVSREGALFGQGQGSPSVLTARRCSWAGLPMVSGAGGVDVPVASSPKPAWTATGAPTPRLFSADCRCDLARYGRSAVHNGVRYPMGQGRSSDEPD